MTSPAQPPVDRGSAGPTGSAVPVGSAGRADDTGLADKPVPAPPGGGMDCIPPGSSPPSRSSR